MNNRILTLTNSIEEALKGYKEIFGDKKTVFSGNGLLFVNFCAAYAFGSPRPVNYKAVFKSVDSGGLDPKVLVEVMTTNFLNGVRPTLDKQSDPAFNFFAHPSAELEGHITFGYNDGAEDFLDRMDVPYASALLLDKDIDFKKLLTQEGSTEMVAAAKAGREVIALRAHVQATIN